MGRNKAQLAATERGITAQALDVLKRRLEQSVAATLEVSSMRLCLQWARLPVSQANHDAATAQADLAAAIGVPFVAVDTVVESLARTDPALRLTAIPVTAPAMLTIAIGSDNPGREILGPMPRSSSAACCPGYPQSVRAADVAAALRALRAADGRCAAGLSSL